VPCGLKTTAIILKFISPRKFCVYTAPRAYALGRKAAEYIMEADWDEVSRIAVPPPSPHVLPTIATATAFDDLQELLWAGNEYVSIRGLRFSMC
jgi:hypothetical protein